MFGYFLARDKQKWLINHYRKEGMKIGDNTHIFSNLSSGEPFLVEIGNNVTISTDVKLITHDACPGALLGRDIASDFFGRIIIGDHTFIGTGAIILPGVTIGEKCVIGAGSVVTKSIPPEQVWGGCPAKFIKFTSDFLRENEPFMFNVHGMDQLAKKEIIINNHHKLLDRKA